MDKLKTIIDEYGRWKALSVYTERIEGYLESDFSHALENAKALLEAIAKEICTSKGIPFEDSASVNSLLKKAFSAMGYSGDEMVTQISSALATIGQRMGTLRNEIGPTSHGRTLAELDARNEKIDDFTKEFLIDSTTIIACFLIRAFEGKNPRSIRLESEKIDYSNEDQFNCFWDELYGEFEMGEYTYTASEILYNADYSAYLTERKAFLEESPESS